MALLWQELPGTNYILGTNFSLRRDWQFFEEWKGNLLKFMGRKPCRIETIYKYMTHTYTDAKPIHMGLLPSHCVMYFCCFFFRCRASQRLHRLISEHQSVKGSAGWRLTISACPGPVINRLGLMAEDHKLTNVKLITASFPYHAGSLPTRSPPISRGRGSRPRITYRSLGLKE